MLKPLQINFKGLITISGPTKSGKSQLAEFLIKDQEYITYIATSNPRINDSEWNKKIEIHKSRRPDSWKLIEHPHDIFSALEYKKDNSTFLLDSLGGLVEQHLSDDQADWESFQFKFINRLKYNDFGIIVVIDEIGWGLVPATPIGHLFRERHCALSLILSENSTQQWLALNGVAINLDKIGDQIP